MRDSNVGLWTKASVRGETMKRILPIIAVAVRAIQAVVCVCHGGNRRLEGCLKI
jgi:hypothetical protein